MHWMDPSSRELFDLIWERIGTARILLLVTTRDQHISLAWSKAAHASTIALDRLDHDDSVTMVTHMTRGKSLPPTVLEEIVQRTDGVPLHVEELTKSILDSGALDAGRDRPSRNRGGCHARPAGLAARLVDGTARSTRPGKANSSIGAVIGREFSFDCLPRFPV